MGTLKSGFKTSEFWLSAATSILAILVMGGVVGPTDSDALAGLVKNLISGIVALIGIVSYVAGRVKLKGGE